MKKITTVILAAGNSSRFKSKHSKIFQDLAGIAIIEHVYNLAKQVSKKNEIIFVCNKKNINVLRDKFIGSLFILQKNQKGTADAITSVKKYLFNTDILILFGDVPLVSLQSINKLIKNFYINNSNGSIIVFKSKNPFGYGRVKTNKKIVMAVVEEINTSKIEKEINLCNSGVIICSSKLLFSQINKISSNNKKKEKYLPDIFNIFYNLNMGFSYILGKKEEMLGVNSIDDFITIDRIYQKKLIEKFIKQSVIIYQPETVRVSYDTKIGKGSTIEPFVFIKTGVKLKENVLIKSSSVIEGCIINKNSSVGPSARIRAKSNIGQNVKIGNFVEVKNSKIGDKCSINHLPYIGDSNLGKRINIGAGTITCNYDGKKKNKTKIENDVFIGSNCSLIAPIIIGKNSTIGAGSVITKNIPKNHLALERSKIKILKKI